MFKPWPPKAFDILSDEQKAAFWRSNSRTRKRMFQDLQVSITQQHVHKEVSSKLGKFLPISVLEKQGY